MCLVIGLGVFFTLFFFEVNAVHGLWIVWGVVCLGFSQLIRHCRDVRSSHNFFCETYLPTCPDRFEGGGQLLFRNGDVGGPTTCVQPL